MNNSEIEELKNFINKYKNFVEEKQIEKLVCCIPNPYSLINKLGDNLVRLLNTMEEQGVYTPTYYIIGQYNLGFAHEGSSCPATYGYEAGPNKPPLKFTSKEKAEKKINWLIKFYYEHRFEYTTPKRNDFFILGLR